MGLALELTELVLKLVAAELMLVAKFCSGADVGADGACW